MNGVLGSGVGVIIGLLGWMSFNLMNVVFLLREIRDKQERRP